jgi:hypothetical protein
MTSVVEPIEIDDDDDHVELEDIRVDYAKPRRIVIIDFNCNA